MPKRPEEDDKNITVWGNPNEKVVAYIPKKAPCGERFTRTKLLSGYGDVTYRKWCELELARMQSTTDNVHIVERESDGMIALARIR